MSGVENTARVEYATTASVAAARSLARHAGVDVNRRGPASSERHGPDADRVAGRQAQITERIVERTARLYDLRVREAQFRQAYRW